MAYLCIFIFAFLGVGLLEGKPYFSTTIDAIIIVIALGVGMWQHALRYKYNPKEGEHDSFSR